MDYNTAAISERIRTLIANDPHINTQGKLGEALGVQQSSVSKWVTGTTLPETNALVRICDTFDVSLDYLFGRTEIKKGLPEGAWLVDLDYAEKVKESGSEPEEEWLAVPIPRRHAIMSSVDYRRFKKQLREHIKGRQR